MLAETGRSVNPGNGGKLASGRGRGELVGGHVLFAPLERRDISLRIPAVVAPGQPGFLQGRWQRGNVEGRLRVDRIAVVRVVDDGRVGRDQHQVVRGRRTGDLGEVLVAERVLLRIAPVVRNVRL